MGLAAARDPPNWQESRTSARPSHEIRKRESGHEHVWWDQASLLVQVGLLDPQKLPVVGVEQARRLLRAAGENRDEAQISVNER
jgi:hypothetical protein